MISETIRCRACGVINVLPVNECTACGTLLPPPPKDGPTPAPHPIPDLAACADGGWPRVRGVAHLFVGVLILFVAGFVAGKLGVPSVQVDLSLTGVFAIVACLCLLLAWSQFSPLLRTAGGWRGLVAALVGFLAIAGFAVVYFPAIRWIGFPVIRLSDAYLEAGWPVWSVYALLSLAPAISEEIAFRGYVMARLDGLFTPTETLLVQAALFALVHLGPVIFPSHFVIGLVLGLIRRRTRSLYPGMLTHAGWNAAVVWTELAGYPFP